MDIKILVNKQNHLNKNFVPTDLIVAETEYGEHLDSNIKTMLVKEAYICFLQMQKEALKNGYHVIVDSGYRPYEYQERIFNKFVEEKGMEEAKKLVALPGTSEHQTGLAFDVALIRNGKYIDDFPEDAREIKWLHENCYKYGFILRYPKGQENITGYSYEPWHFRYVGKELSEELYENNQSLEEYYDLNKKL